MRRYIAFTLALALLLTGSALAAGKKIGMLQVGSSRSLEQLLRGYSAKLFTWSSSDENVAQVSDGVITGVGAGCAIITASAAGKSASVGVIVMPTSVSVKAGEIYTLPGGKLAKYASADTSVVRVSANGVIGGLTAGTTRVGVKYAGQLMTIDVTVTDEATDSAIVSPTPAPDPVTDEDSGVANLDCAETAEQIVLVKYQGGSDAELSVHQKIDGSWTELFSCDAYVGKNGIGKTCEGDKKTPSGTFNLCQPFGIKDDPGAKMQYTKVTKYHYWCGTSASPYYNQLVDTRRADREATSSDEKLIEYTGVYNYAMFIDYNADGVADKGSCIFLHCTGSNRYTAGCIAVEEDIMKQIIRWAKPGCKIVIC